MKLSKALFLIYILIFSSCGFEDNLPCRGSDCDDIPEQVPNTDNEG